MSNQLPVALFVTDGQKANVEAVLHAYRGEPTLFGRKLIPTNTPNPTPESEPTHWLMFDASTNQDNVTVYQGFANGDLPPLDDPEAAWGSNGLISAQDAMEAINGANLQVYSVSGDVVPLSFLGGILESRDLMFVPEIEV